MFEHPCPKCGGPATRPKTLCVNCVDEEPANPYSCWRCGAHGERAVLCGRREDGLWECADKAGCHARFNELIPRPADDQPRLKCGVCGGPVEVRCLDPRCTQSQPPLPRAEPWEDPNEVEQVLLEALSASNGLDHIGWLVRAIRAVNRRLAKLEGIGAAKTIDTSDATEERRRFERDVIEAAVAWMESEGAEALHDEARERLLDAVEALESWRESRRTPHGT